MRFAIQQVRINNVYAPGMQGYQLDRAQDTNSDGSDGTLFETAHHVTAYKPKAELSWFDLEGIVDKFTASADCPVLSLDGTNGLEMWGARSATNLPGFATGSVHSRRRAKRGVIALSSLRWSKGEKAIAQLSALLFSADGLTDSIEEDDAIAQPTVPVPDFGYALTALTIAGATITAVNSLDLTIDHKLDHEHSTGLPHPVAVLGAGVRGKLGITLKADIGHLDLGDGTGATSLVFTKYAGNGGFAAKTVTFTLNGVWGVSEQEGGENNQAMTRQLLVRTRYDGTNRPLTVAKA